MTKLPMKYALKYIIFSVVRKNKNYIYVSENWGQPRKQPFNKDLKPANHGINLSDDTSIFDKIIIFISIILISIIIILIIIIIII